MTHIRTASIALALALCAGTAAAQEPGIRDRPFLTVLGQGKVSARPDLARLTVSVTTRVPGREATLDAASKRHAPRAKAAADALAGLKDRGVAVREGMFTMAMERGAVRPRDGDEPTQQAAVATTRFDVAVSPVDGLDAAVSAIAATGLFEVQGVSYELADPKGQLDAARRAAMADAIEQSRLYAEAGGFRTDGIVAVQDGQARVMDRPVPGMMAMRAAAPPMEASAPATIDTESSVTVTWRIAGRGEGLTPRD